MRKYQIEVSEEQLVVLVKALETFFRLRMGQHDQIPWHIFPDRVMQTDRAQADALLNRAFVLYRGQPCNGGSNSEMDGPWEHACDMYQIFRYKLSWTQRPQGPDGMNVWFNEPLLRAPGYPAKIEVIEPKEVP